MTEYVIELYDTFNTKGCPEDLTFGDLNYQPIPSTYSDLKNDYDDDSTQIDASLTDNEGVEDAAVTNNENNDENILASDIDPPQNNIMETEEAERISNETEESKI